MYSLYAAEFKWIQVHLWKYLLKRHKKRQARIIFLSGSKNKAKKKHLKESYLIYFALNIRITSWSPRKLLETFQILINIGKFGRFYWNLNFLIHKFLFLFFSQFLRSFLKILQHLEEKCPWEYFTLFLSSHCTFCAMNHCIFTLSIYLRAIAAKMHVQCILFIYFMKHPR